MSKSLNCSAKGQKGKVSRGDELHRIGSARIVRFP